MKTHLSFFAMLSVVLCLGAMTSGDARIAPRAFTDQSGSALAQNPAMPDSPRGELSSDDVSFINDVMQAGMAEIAEARLASERSRDEQVRQVAEHILADHEQSNEQLRSIAVAHQVPLPSSPNAEQEQHARILEELTGEAFEAEYVRHQLEAHRKSIALYERTARQTENPQLKAYANKSLPVLKQHLAMLQKLQNGRQAQR